MEPRRRRQICACRKKRVDLGRKFQKIGVGINLGGGNFIFLASSVRRRRVLRCFRLPYSTVVWKKAPNSRMGHWRISPATEFPPNYA